MITITYLGTGTSGGVPMIGCNCAVCRSTDKKDKRLRSSILVKSDTTTLVVDTGPDFRYQMLRANVQTLDAVVFTHPHKDHVAGLDDVRAYNYWSKKPMQVYANEMTQAVLVREFPYAFADTKYPGVPDIKLNTIDDTPFEIGDIRITPIMVWHMKMPVMGFRFNDFTYITDANRIDDAEMKKIEGSKVLTLNTLRKEQHISHFTLAQGIEIAQNLKVGQAFFTHLSHQMGKHADVEQELPAGINIAYDGLQVQI